VKKIIALLLLAAAGYWGYKNFDSLTAGPGAFDEKGNPRVILFTMDECGAPCGDVAAALRKRDVAFEEVNVSTDKGRSRLDKFGEMRLPLTAVGRTKVVGNDLVALESALAEASVQNALTPAEQMVMRNHFDEKGKPRVVMYGTDWCPQCRRTREYLQGRKIPCLYINVEADRSAMRDYNTLNGTGYPLTFVGYRRIVGFDENRISQAVKDLM
jgi:glutaredoxin